MKLKEILPESCFASIATIKGEESIEKAFGFIEHNKPFLKKFQSIYIHTNRLAGVSNEIVREYMELWWSLPNTRHVGFSEYNRGHMFGTIDLEENILIRIKRKYRYVWKSMDDILLSDKILELEVPRVDFYYIPSFSYESLVKAGKNIEHLLDLPQTTFFIANIEDIDTLYGNDVERKYNLYQDHKSRNPNVKPWEIPFSTKFDCENHLYRTYREKLRYNLLYKAGFEELYDHVKNHKVGDPSHKNIMLTQLGVCHFHHQDQPVYEI